MQPECPDCGEKLNLYTEHGLWLPKHIEGMGRSCRIRYGKVCAQPKGHVFVEPRIDPFHMALGYPEMNRA